MAISRQVRQYLDVKSASGIITIRLPADFVKSVLIKQAVRTLVLLVPGITSTEYTQ